MKILLWVLLLAGFQALYAQPADAGADSTGSSPAPVQRQLYFTQHPTLDFDAPLVARMVTQFKSPDRTPLFYYCFGMVLFLGVVRNSFAKYFADLFRIFYRSNFRQNHLREQLSQNRLASLLLNCLFFLGGGMFINLLLHDRLTAMSINFWQGFALSTAALALLYAGKYLVVQISGWMLHARDIARTYTFIVFLVNKIIGILLVPVVIMMALGYRTLGEVALTTCLVALGLLILYRFVQGFQLVKSRSRAHPVHFFLYFCAFEILPFFLIGKFAITAMDGAA